MDIGIINTLHYLDNFIVVAQSRETARKKTSELVSTFVELGVEPSKLKWPGTCLTFLGIEQKTCRCSLPKEKLDRLQATLEQTMEKSHPKEGPAKPGGFIATCNKGAQNHFIRLLLGRIFYGGAESWNGISTVWVSGEISPDIQVVSDTASSWRCGAQWFFLQWPPQLQSK